MLPDAGKRRPPAVSTIVSAEEDDDDEDLDEDDDDDVIDEGDEGGDDDDDHLETPVKLPAGSGREESKYGGGGGGGGRWNGASAAAGGPRRDSAGDDTNTTPRVQKAVVPAVKQSPYYGLQDAPSPVGRLSDRIQRLRQRCIEALGRDAFADAHAFLKRFEENHAADGRFYEEDAEEEKVARMRDILGDGKAHYMPLIEQLIFMEETHHG